MTLLTKRGAGTPTTTGTTWATVTNAVDGTPPANPATYATWTSSTSGAVATIEITGYAFSATIGAGDTLTSVSVRVRHLVSNVARYASITYQCFSGGSAIGSPTAATLTTAAHDDTATIAVTLAQLRAATFAVRVTATRAAVTQSGVWSVDHVDVTADYSPPGVARDLAGKTDTAASATATTVVRARALAGRAPSAEGSFAALSVVAGPVAEGFRVARTVSGRAGTGSGASGALTTVPAVGPVPEGFRVARPVSGRTPAASGARGLSRTTRTLAARAGTASGATGSLVTAAPDVVNLAGGTQSATNARGLLRATRPLVACGGGGVQRTGDAFDGRPVVRHLRRRAPTASGARSGVLVTRLFVARAPSASDAYAGLTVYAGELPGGTLATFRLRVAGVLEGIDPATTHDVFALFREQVTDALTSAEPGGDVFASLREQVAMTLDTLGWEVHAGPVDSLTPPAFMLEWADPWTTPGTHCMDYAHLEILCIGPRIEPDAGIETLELMVEAALAALQQAGIAHGETSAPRPFDIGGIPYLAARIPVHNLVTIGA